ATDGPAPLRPARAHARRRARLCAAHHPSRGTAREPLGSARTYRVPRARNPRYELISGSRDSSHVPGCADAQRAPTRWVRQLLLRSVMAADLMNVMELPILPLRTMVLFPHAALPMTLNRAHASHAVTAAGEDGLLAVVTQAHPEIEMPGGGDLYAIGTGA